MTVTLETLVKQMTDSGVITAGKLEAFVPPRANPSSAEELVAELVRSNHLTEFQAAQCAAGKSKSLILGGYTLLDKIGEGGMGQVFKAHHRRMDRLVAIKMLPTASTGDAAAVARFDREVKAVAKLEHPNIVAAYDADQADGVHFLVMQYVEGRDLAVLCKEIGPLSVAKATDYILQAARGLEFAHFAGVVHRDIKPANLLLDKKGVVKILDMGLARLDQTSGAFDHPLTMTGDVMGTVDFMPPEQATNIRSADARSDIYSLGCTWFRLLTNRSMYPGVTVVEKLMAHMRAPVPSLMAIRPDVSPELERLFKTMVAKEPADRIQTATELIAALERLIAAGLPDSAPVSASPFDTIQLPGQEAHPASFETASLIKPEFPTSIQSAEGNRPPTAGAVGGPVTPKPEAGGRRKRPWLTKRIAIGAGGIALLAALGVWITVRDKDGRETARIELPEGGRVGFETTPGVVATTSTAMLAPISNRQTVPSADRAVSGATSGSRPAPNAMIEPPPKKEIPTVPGRLRVPMSGLSPVMAIGGAPARIAAVSAAPAQTLHWLEASTGHEIWRMPLLSISPNGLAVSPDGSRIALSAMTQNVPVKVYECLLIDTTTKQVLKRVELSADVLASKFSDDGKTLAVAHRTDGIQLFDGATLAPIRKLSCGSNIVFSMDLARDGSKVGAACFAPSVSPEHEIPPFDEPFQSLLIWNVSTGDSLPKIAEERPSGTLDFAFSNDGRWVLAAHRVRGLRLWNLADGKHLATVPMQGVVAARMEMLHTREVAVCYGHQIQLVALPSCKVIQKLNTTGLFTAGIAVSPDDRYVVSVHHGLQELFVWDLTVAAAPAE